MQYICFQLPAESFDRIKTKVPEIEIFQLGKFDESEERCNECCES